MIQMVIYFQIERNNGEREKLLPDSFSFFPPLCYLLVRIVSLIIGKKKILGLGWIDGMFLSSSLFFFFFF